jgi:hypothetical protein
MIDNEVQAMALLDDVAAKLKDLIPVEEVPHAMIAHGLDQIADDAHCSACLQDVYRAIVEEIQDRIASLDLPSSEATH